MNKIRIAVAEDNVFLTNAIKEKLSFFDDLELVFTALDGEKFLKKLNKISDIDLVLMDIEMPHLNGIDTTEKVKQMNPNIKVVMLTVLDDYDSIFQAIRVGANGYLLKETNPQQLHDAILQTMDGGAAMTPIIAKKTLQLLRNPRIQEQDKGEEIKLTKRETEILEQLSKGLTNTQIAENFSRSPKTIRNHIENIYKKLQVHSKIEAIEKAKKNYLI